MAPKKKKRGLAMTPARALARVAREIERLKPEFPQLVNFAASRNFHPDRLVIEYGYRTHASAHRGGWTSGVPNPDEVGIWFTIDIHPANSTAQIHTQPVLPPLRFGRSRVGFLILEGSKTKRISSRLVEIFEKCGIRIPDQFHSSRASRDGESANDVSSTAPRIYSRRRAKRPPK